MPCVLSWIVSCVYSRHGFRSKEGTRLSVWVGDSGIAELCSVLDIERVVLPFYWPTDELTDQLTDRLTYLHADVFRLAARAAHRLVNHRLGVRQRDPLAARACAQD